MTDSRKDKQQKLVRTLLDESAIELVNASEYLFAVKTIESGEFEAAIASLIDFGEKNQVSRNFWLNLKQAAGALELRHYYAHLRKKLLSSRPV